MVIGLVFGALAFAAIMLLVSGALSDGSEYEAVGDEDFEYSSVGSSVVSKNAFSEALDSFNKIVTARPRGSKIAERLARADLKLKPSEYYLATAGVMVGVFLLVYVINRSFIPALILSLGSYFLPGVYVRYRQGKRLRLLGTQFGDTILLMSNALKAGYSFAQAMTTIARSSPPPMGEEFNRAVREMNLGIDVDTTLDHMNKRINSEDFDLMVTAVQIHRIVGGNLAEILDTIAFTIRERIRIHGEIRTLTAQARASGYIITGLPFALALILYVVSPSYIVPLFTNFLGWIMLTVAAVMMLIGYYIIRRIN